MHLWTAGVTWGLGGAIPGGHSRGPDSLLRRHGPLGGFCLSLPHHHGHKEKWGLTGHQASRRGAHPRLGIHSCPGKARETCECCGPSTAGEASACLQRQATFQETRRGVGQVGQGSDWGRGHSTGCSPYPYSLNTYGLLFPHAGNFPDGNAALRTQMLLQRAGVAPHFLLCHKKGVENGQMGPAKEEAILELGPPHAAGREACGHSPPKAACDRVG